MPCTRKRWNLTLGIYFFKISEAKMKTVKGLWRKIISELLDINQMAKFAAVIELLPCDWVKVTIFCNSLTKYICASKNQRYIRELPRRLTFYQNNVLLWKIVSNFVQQTNINVICCSIRWYELMILMSWWSDTWNELFLPFFLRPQDGSCHFLGTSKSVPAGFFKTARFIKFPLFQSVLWMFSHCYDLLECLLCICSA